MSIVRKAMTVMMLGKTLSSSTPMMHRLLTGLIAIASLSLILAIMAGTFIVGALYFLYYMFVTHGLDQQTAMLTIGGIILILGALFLGLIVRYIRRIQELPREIAYMEAPVGQKIGSILDAFIDGLVTRQRY